MRVTEILRSLLDLIDGVEAANPPPVQHVTIAINADTNPAGSEVQAPLPDELARIKQIAGLMKNDAQTYANEPSEQIADIDSVTVDAGGGLNGPKHPSDIRSNATSMYPNTQYRGN
jgi:hypothetical protein